MLNWKFLYVPCFQGNNIWSCPPSGHGGWASALPQCSYAHDLNDDMYIICTKDKRNHLHQRYKKIRNQILYGLLKIHCTALEFILSTIVKRHFSNTIMGPPHDQWAPQDQLGPGEMHRQTLPSRWDWLQYCDAHTDERSQEARQPIWGCFFNAFGTNHVKVNWKFN